VSSPTRAVLLPRSETESGSQTTEYALIMVVAAHRSVLAYKSLLTPEGRYLYVGGSVATLLQVLLLGPLLGRAESKQLRLLAVQLGAEGLAPMVALCQAGTVATVIDRRYRLSEVPEALRYLGEGHAKGKLVAILE
jgi:NADPH:quinone reductase-like Zn-dependent oxidoreductase